MIHIDFDNDVFEMAAGDITELAAEATIALEIIACTFMLERGQKSSAGFLVGEISRVALERLENPEEYVWEIAKALLIGMIKEARNEKEIH